MKKGIYVLIFLAGLINPAIGQIGREFWFAAPNINNSHADEPLSLNISTFDAAATVTVSIPANPGFTPIVTTVNPNSLGIIVLECHSDSRANPPHYNCGSNPVNFKTLLETDVWNSIQNKGLFISSTSDISVYYEVLGSNCNVSRCKVANADIFPLKSENALGTEFYVSMQNGHSTVTLDFWNDALGGKNANSLYIVATEDDTDIEITPTVNLIGGNMANATFSISLNKGQTYAIKGLGNAAAENLSGTHITSTHPIAVTACDDSPADRDDFAAHANKPEVYDLAGDQLIPASQAGKEFIVSKFYAYVTCTENSTNISVNGILTATKNKGETYEIDLRGISGPAYINSDKPVLLFHLRGIAGLDGYPEFGGAVVPHIACTGSRTVRFSRSTDEYKEQFFLTVLVRSNGINDFTLNGNPALITASDFVSVPGTTDWMYMEKEFDKTAIPSFQTSTVSNSSSIFHLGIVYGRPHIDKVLPLDSVSTGCRYGYFSNFGKADININVTNQCLQQGQNLVINPGGFNQYYWYKNNIFLHSNSTLEINQGGDYSLKVTDLTGCSDSTGFTISLGTIPDFKLPTDTILCTGEQINLKIENGTEGNNPDYNWYFQPKGNSGLTSISSDSFILAKEPGLYKLTVNTPNCGSYSDSVNIDQWNVFVPNLFTPNNDDHNDAFYIAGIDKGKWMLYVYNRWGNRVFFSEDYNNSWTADEIKEKENEGLLFYYLEEEKTKQCNKYKGWVQVIR